MTAQSCFVFGCQLDGAGGAQPVHEDHIDSTDAPCWLHLDYSLGNAEQWLCERGIDANVAESLVRADTRPRCLAVHNGLLVVLRGVNSNPGEEPEDMVSLRMWIEPQRIITVRQRRLLSVQDVRNLLDTGSGPTEVAQLVVLLIERLADRIADFVESIEERIAAHEADVELVDANQSRRQVTALRRQTAVVRRFLAPQRDALDNLYRQSRGLLNEDQHYAVREQADRITRYVEDLDLVRERSLVIQEELMNRIAQQQNARMYVLSIVAAIFLPITFITGLFGMNVAGLPGTEDSNAFLLVCAAMLAVSVVVALLLRIRRWY